MKSAALSAIMTTGMWMLPEGTVGIAEASTTRRPRAPRTRNLKKKINHEYTIFMGNFPLCTVYVGKCVYIFCIYCKFTVPFFEYLNGDD